MKKSLTVLALTATLVGGSTAVATTFASPAQAAASTVSASGGAPATGGQESDKTGLWGLLGLLGLAGLAKRKEHTDTHATGSARR